MLYDKKATISKELLGQCKSLRGLQAAQRGADPVTLQVPGRAFMAPSPQVLRVVCALTP